ncbi:hypothetical protein [Comamonas sp. JC664]|uniref:hypothetical protein n=1 Tax=Comamonas sp. JC664 TaxID=2801917 RepID=UPI00360BFD2B
MGFPDAETEAVRSLDDLRWFVAQAALGGKDVVLSARPGAGAAVRSYRLPLSSIDAR